MGTGKLARRTGHYRSKTKTMNESVIINLSERYALAFGAVMAGEVANRYFIATKQNNEYSVETYPAYNNDFEKVKFKYSDKVLEFASMMQGDNKNIFAPPLIIKFSRTKKLIETHAKGSDNIIVERWGTNSWNINISGILVDMENKYYPSGKITELHKFFAHNDIISVSGMQFAEKEIDSFYLKSVDIEPITGFSDTIKFSLSARSIKAVGYSLINPDAK